MQHTKVFLALAIALAPLFIATGCSRSEETDEGTRPPLIGGDGDEGYSPRTGGTTTPQGVPPSQPPKPALPSTPNNDSNSTTIPTANELAEEFQANPSRALAKYRQQGIVVTGRIDGIQTDYATINTTITWNSRGDTWMFILTFADLNDLRALNKGETVTVRGTVNAYALGDGALSIGDCKLVR
jgi:hypothetical protein